MHPQSIVIHERIGTWSRQIRPRFRGWPIRWSETRSTAEFARAASESSAPIFVIDLGDRPGPGLEALDAGLARAPRALSLVLDPLSLEGLRETARELGATVVLAGPVVPPEVVALLHRWLPIARHRSEADGWSVPSGAIPGHWSSPGSDSPLGPFSTG